MAEFLNTPLDEADGAAFEKHPDLCPCCSEDLAYQEDGAHEYECGAFLVREATGAVWKHSCPHHAEQAA